MRPARREVHPVSQMMTRFARVRERIWLEVAGEAESVSYKTLTNRITALFENPFEPQHIAAARNVQPRIKHKANTSGTLSIYDSCKTQRPSGMGQGLSPEDEHLDTDLCCDRDGRLLNTAGLFSHTHSVPWELGARHLGSYPEALERLELRPNCSRRMNHHVLDLLGPPSAAYRGPSSFERHSPCGAPITSGPWLFSASSRAAHVSIPAGKKQNRDPSLVKEHRSCGYLSCKYNGR
ncbi:hypothetical protein ANO11243_055500 [Dothideomycetidae sp. 11243]|nr:hypothetical protein ANO11243_055500 [fungal sp. No.11243]